jgi:hypothetical protein
MDALKPYAPPEPIREEETINDVSQSIEFFTQSLNVNVDGDKNGNGDVVEEIERPARRKPDKYAVHTLLQSIHSKWYEASESHT